MYKPSVGDRVIVDMMKTRNTRHIMRRHPYVPRNFSGQICKVNYEFGRHLVMAEPIGDLYSVMVECVTPAPKE